MSAAPEAAAAEAAPKKGKKKLIIILAAVLLLVLGGGGAALMMMKKKHAEEEAAAAEEGGEEHAEAKPKAKPKKKAADKDGKAPPPVFLPLEPFTVNLADRDADRYAQIGVTLELDEAPTSDLIKNHLPAIRNNILLAISHKTAAELLDLEGKQKLALEIQRESLLPLGVEMEIEEDEPEEEGKPAKKPRKKKAFDPTDYPVVAVHFSNFIIQ